MEWRSYIRRPEGLIGPFDHFMILANARNIGAVGFDFGAISVQQASLPLTDLLCSAWIEELAEAFAFAIYKMTFIAILALNEVADTLAVNQVILKIALVFELSIGVE